MSVVLLICRVPIMLLFLCGISGVAAAKPKDKEQVLLSQQELTDKHQKALSLILESPIQALALFDEIIAADAHFCLAYVNAGAVLEMQYRYEQAQNRYVNGLRVCEKTPELYQSLVGLYLRDKNINLAEKYMQQAEKNIGMVPIYEWIKIQVLLAQKKYEEVLKIALSSFRKDPKNIEILNALAFAYIGLDKADLANFTLQNALAAQPENATIYHALGSLALLQNDKTRALSMFKKAVYFRPDSVFSWLNISQLQLELQDYANAFESASIANQLAPQLKDAALVYAHASRGVGRYMESEKIYLRLLAANSNDASVLYDLGVFYLMSPLSYLREDIRFKKSQEYLSLAIDAVKVQKNSNFTLKQAEQYLKEASIKKDQALKKQVPGKPSSMPTAKVSS